MKKIILIQALALFTGALMLFSSCSKQDSNGGNPAAQTKKNLDRKVRDLLTKLPHARYKSGGPGNGANPSTPFNFSNHSSGFNFSASPEGVNFSTNTGSIFFSAGSFGASTGGTVVAGNSSLDINYTFCFSASDSATGLDLFDMGNGGFTDVSAVIGVSGDFSELGNANDSSDFGDFFHGLAFYIVYVDEAEGAHDVVDWFDDISDSTATDDNAFAFVMDFQRGAVYLSTGGKITVSGGSMNFNGEYLEVSGFFDPDFDISGELTYRIVSGFGTMGCN